MTVSSKTQIRAALAFQGSRRRPCLLCGSASDWSAVWIPRDRDDHWFEQWHGEKSGFTYSLCRVCANLDDSIEQVEATLIAQWGTRNG